jgi:signal transduction histidine kinase
VRHRFIVRYAPLLVLAAALLIIVAGLVQHQLGQQQSDARVTNVAGRQRMLSQRLGRLALQAAHAPDAPTRQRHQAAMQRALADWTDAHAALLHGGGVRALPGVRRPELRQSLLRLGQLQGQAKTAARAFGLRLDAHRPGTPPPDGLLQSLDALLGRLDAFLAQMEGFVLAYDQAAEARVDQTQVFALGLGALALAALVVLAVLALHPVARLLGELRVQNYRLYRTNAQLVAARRKAKESDRAKSVFFANMSHEIRTPLTSILGFADILGDSVTEEQRTFVAMIRRSGKRLRQMLTSVLEMAHLEAGEVELAVDVLDVDAVARDLVDRLQADARAEGLTLCADLPEAPVRALGHESTFVRAMRNVIENAIKYTERGYVLVSVHIYPDEVAVCVQDTGPGIAPRFQERLFSAFEQESEGLGRIYEGAGLGLAVSNGLMEGMGGRITVESEVGRGSLFTLFLPRHHASADEAHATRGASGCVGGNDERSSLPVAASAGKRHERTPRPTASSRADLSAEA